MPNVADPEDLLMSQDVIFVGGGSVANMVAVWRVHGIDEILRKAWQAGIVLAGSSAGGICWFEGGTTDSFGIKLRAFTDGLAMLPGSFCPHYHSEAERRPLYQRLVADGALPGGIACDDGTAAHFTDETLAEQVSDRPARTPTWSRKTARTAPRRPRSRCASSAHSGSASSGRGLPGHPPRLLAGCRPEQRPAQGGEDDQRQQPPRVDACHVGEDRGERRGPRR